MKKKSLMLLMLFAIVSTMIIWLLNSPSPQLRSIVSKTQLHIKNINSKLLDDDEEEDGAAKELEGGAEQTYLELLGFVKDPNLFDDKQSELSRKLLLQRQQAMRASKSKVVIYDDDQQQSENEQQQQIEPAMMPVLKSSSRITPLVTAFSRFGEKENYLIESKMNYFLNDLILIYDLDLSSSEHLKLKKKCNSSCTIKMFKAEKYPRHIREAKMKAYKPIIIQEVLNEYGSLIWVEPPNVFISNNVEKYLNKTKSTSGLLAWSLQEPVSQLTHPSMFKYFNAKPADFYFVHMLDTSQLIIYNNWNIHTQLMLPWVKCALKEECIAPLGAQYSGCDFNRLPIFLYSGCHRYEMSAFSIITSQLFDFDESRYTMELEQTEPTMAALFDELKKNKMKKNKNKNKLPPSTLESGGYVDDDDLQLTVEQIDQMAGSFIQKYYQNSFMTPISLLTKTSNDLLTMSGSGGGLGVVSDAKMKQQLRNNNNNPLKTIY